MKNKTYNIYNMPHLALGSDGHKIPAHGAVVHNTQTGEHKQIKNEVVVDSESESESEHEVDVEAMKRHKAMESYVKEYKKQDEEDKKKPKDDRPGFWKLTTADGRKIMKLLPSNAPLYNAGTSAYNGGHFKASNNEMEDFKNHYLLPNNEDGKYTSLINKINKQKNKIKYVGDIEV